MAYIPFFRRAFAFLCIFILLVITTSTALTPEEELGKQLFFDTDLSNPPGQSCSACHSPEVGFTGSDSAINAGGAVYEGAVDGRFGNRKPPAAAYAGDSPILYYNSGDGTWTGGMFWDGRATGWTLGDPLAEQAQGPFLNPLEQNLPSAAAAVNIMKGSSYASLFEQVWGPGSLDDPVNINYNRIAQSIAAYERSEEVNPFSSRYDAYLEGMPTLTTMELQGLALFEGKAQCSACHSSEQGPSGESPLFTDFTYDNLGVPRNEDNPFYDELSWNPLGDAWVDNGLGGFLWSTGNPDFTAETGKMKVPTLRNVDKRPSPEFVKAYAHNGYFKSLEEIVHFYNTRDTLPQCSDPLVPGENPGVNCWPAPEVAANINTDELGDLGLTANEETAIVAYLKTLTDVYWGCSPGYWKNHANNKKQVNAWPANYLPTDLISSPFPEAEPSYGSKTLLQALSLKGGKGTNGAQEILLRSGTAALLNEATFGTDYSLCSYETVEDVRSAVNDALSSSDRQAMLNLATTLDYCNNQYCPLS
jgi:cytochrome c peroxidase